MLLGDTEIRPNSNNPYHDNTATALYGEIRVVGIRQGIRGGCPVRGA